MQKLALAAIILLVLGCHSASGPTMPSAAPSSASPESAKAGIASPSLAPTGAYSAADAIEKPDHVLYKWNIANAGKISAKFAAGQTVETKTMAPSSTFAIDMVRGVAGHIAVTLSIVSGGATAQGTFNVGTSETDCRKLISVNKNPISFSGGAPVVAAKGVGAFPTVTVSASGEGAR